MTVFFDSMNGTKGAEMSATAPTIMIDIKE